MTPEALYAARLRRYASKLMDTAAEAEVDGMDGFAYDLEQQANRLWRLADELTEAVDPWCGQ